MNKYLLLLTLIISLINNDIVPFQIMGSMQQNIEIYPGYDEANEISWVADFQQYTDGGLTFTYPEDIFSLPPYAFFTVETDINDTSKNYCVTITNNSASSTTVVVTETDSTGTHEAADGSVYVHLWAFGS